MKNSDKNERGELIKKINDDNVIYLSRENNKGLSKTLESIQQSFKNYYYKKFYFAGDALFQIIYDKNFRPSTFKLIISSNDNNKMSIENIISLNRKYSDFIKPTFLNNEDTENGEDFTYLKTCLRNGLLLQISNVSLPLTIIVFTFLKYFGTRNQDILFRNFMLAVTANIMSNYYLNNKISNYKYFELPKHLKIKYEKEINIYKSFYNLDEEI